MESFTRFDTSTALQALLVANTLEYNEQKELHQKILNDCYAELRQIADEIQLGFAFERLPLSKNAKFTILMSLDYDVTGGKYHVWNCRLYRKTAGGPHHFGWAFEAGIQRL